MEFITDSVHLLVPRLVMAEMVLGIVVSLMPLGVALVLGLLIGWSWRPSWASLPVLGIRDRSRLFWNTTAHPSLGARRLWLALTALSAFTLIKNVHRRWKAAKSVEQCAAFPSPPPSPQALPTASPVVVQEDSACLSDADDEQPGLDDSDFESLLSYIDEKDEGPGWQPMMDRTTTSFTYQAWRRDPEAGPTQYCSRTVFENVKPELLRDFFWDDDFRTKWDDMLIYCRTLQEYPHNGTMIVHWIRKFPFFCGDREYIIIRRIWESENAYYCITKSTPFPALPRHRKPRRVDLYYSSWRIRAVESREAGGRLTASEVLLFHHEDMGIPKELAKIGVRRGMWGLVEKLNAGLQSYQMMQASSSPPSHCATMAHITTKALGSEVPEPELELFTADGDTKEQIPDFHGPKKGTDMLKWLIVGGVAIALGLNRGTITELLVLGIGKCCRRFRRKNGTLE